MYPAKILRYPAIYLNLITSKYVQLNSMNLTKTPSFNKSMHPVPNQKRKEICSLLKLKKSGYPKTFVGYIQKYNLVPFQQCYLSSIQVLYQKSLQTWQEDFQHKLLKEMELIQQSVTQSPRRLQSHNLKKHQIQWYSCWCHCVIEEIHYSKIETQFSIWFINLTNMFSVNMSRWQHNLLKEPTIYETQSGNHN